MLYMLPGILCNNEDLHFNINESQKQPAKTLIGQQCFHEIFQVHHGSEFHKGLLWSMKASFADVI